MNLLYPTGERPIVDSYESQRIAAFYALLDLANEKAAWQVEYGGWIYRNADGTYSYGPPTTDPSAHNIHYADFSKYCGGSQIVGQYHSHPPVDGNGWEPSSGPGNDLDNAATLSKGYPGYHGYILGPQGQFTNYDQYGVIESIPNVYSQANAH